jgi:hypothetical protein
MAQGACDVNAAPLSLRHFPLFGTATDLPSLRGGGTQPASGAGPKILLMAWPRPTVRLEARTEPSCPSVSAGRLKLTGRRADHQP